MFPAFRVKGIWPNARKPAGIHPVTGVPLSNYELTDTILQLPLGAYDAIIERYPESRLKYFDEDKDEVTIGSKLELAAKLQESTLISQTPRLSRAADPKLYTSNPDFLHGFHIDDTDAARKPWPFFVSRTILRNQPARELWTGAVRVDANDLYALLYEHAYDFMRGFSQEKANLKPLTGGIGRHWERIQELHSQAKTSSSGSVKTPETLTNGLKAAETNSSPVTPTSSPTHFTEPSKANGALNADSKAIPSRSEPRISNITAAIKSSSATAITGDLEDNEQPDPADGLSLAHEAITKDMASLHQELDEHLEKTQALTRMFDERQDSSSRVVVLQSLKEQLDACQETAQAKAKLAMKQMAKSYPMSSCQPSLLSERSSHHHDPVLLGAPRAFPHSIFPSSMTVSSSKTSKTTQKEQDGRTNDQSPRLVNAFAHLTDLGMKDSYEAGLQLRNRLHAGSAMVNTSQERQKTRQQISADFDAAKLGTTTKQAESSPIISTPAEVMASAGRKKSVRFSIPPFVGEEYLSDGDFWSPGTQDFEPQIPSNDNNMTSELESLRHAVLQLQADAQKQQASPSLSQQDLVKVRELVKVFDEHSGPVSEIPQRYRDNLKTSAMPSKSAKTPKSAAASSFMTKSASRDSQAAGVAKPDSVETTVTKLWCQAVEGIMSNVETFAGQLDVHVKSQIAQEQDTWTAALAENSPPQFFENDQAFLDNARHSKDLIAVQENVQGMINVLRFWHKASKNLLAPSELCLEQEIDTARVKKMNEQLRVMALSMVGHFEALYYTFVPANNDTSTAGSETPKPARRVPRRYASKADFSNDKIRSDKKHEKSSQPCRQASASRKPERKDISPAKQEAPSACSVTASASQSSRAVSVEDLKGKNLAFSAPVASEHRLIPDSEASTAIIQNQHPSRRFSWSSTDEASIYHWQQSGFAFDAHRTPEAVGSSKESSDALLPGFPPLIPQREPKQEKRVSNQRSMPDMRTQRQADHAHNSSYYTWLDDTATGRPSQQESTTASSRHSWHVGSDSVWPRMNPYSSHRPQSLIEPSSSNRAHASHFESYRDDISVPSHDTTSNSRQHLSNLEKLIEDTIPNGRIQLKLEIPKTKTSSAYPSIRKTVAEPLSNDDVFHLFQDIPEHRDPKTANKILRCVEGLKDMGYGREIDGGDARLVVYAQAAKGNLMAALDIIEEERKAYRQQGHASGSVF